MGEITLQTNDKSTVSKPGAAHRNLFRKSLHPDNSIASQNAINETNNQDNLTTSVNLISFPLEETFKKSNIKTTQLTSLVESSSKMTSSYLSSSSLSLPMPSTTSLSSSSSLLSLSVLSALSKSSIPSLSTVSRKLSSSLLTSATSGSVSSSSSSGIFKFIPSMDLYKSLAITFLVILEILLVPVSAGPVNVRHHRMARDIYSNLDIIKPTVSTQNVTQDGTCLLDGVPTKRATIHCETKTGCKAIQKTGYCCPEYQCECEKDGKIYSNGETLPDQHQSPCTVCFCKGGEIVCTNVTCYKRDDCEPKYIPGRCCPEYDNCPPLDIGKATTSKTVTGVFYNIATETSSNSPQKNGGASTTLTASIVHHQPSHEMPLHNPLNITIKEITKGEEIRITDAPPVSNGINGINLPKTKYATSNPILNTKNALTQQSINSIEGKTIDDDLTSTSGKGGESQLNTEKTKLTLVETKTILFPATDNSPYDKYSTTPTNSPSFSTYFSTIEPNNKVVISDNNLLNGEESIKIVRHASIPTSNKGEHNLIQHGTGEKDKHVTGVKGGNDLDTNKRKNTAKEFESNESGEIDPILASGSDDFVRVIYKSSTENINELLMNDAAAGETVNDTKAGEDEVFDSVWYNEEISSSSVAPTGLSNSSEIYDAVHYTPEPEAGEAQLNDTSEESKIFDSVFHETEEEKIYDSIYYDHENQTVSTHSPESSSSEPFPYDNDEEGENPAYPKIEEDLSLHAEINGAAYESDSSSDQKFSHEISHPKEEARSVATAIHPNILENSKLRADTLQLDSSTESSHYQLDFSDESDDNNTALNDIFDSEVKPEARVPGEPCLIPEWERFNGTHSSRCNHTYYFDTSAEDYGIIEMSQSRSNESWPTSSEVDIDFGSGSGSGYSAINLIDNREPTTPNPRKIIDIDDIDGGSGNDTNLLTKDPKDDAESLKIDDDENSSSGSGIGLNGAGIAGEINKKALKSFYDFDSFLLN